MPTPGSQASFNQYRFNGRPLHIDAYDLMLTLGANKAIADGVSPDRERIINSFPYYGLEAGLLGFVVGRAAPQAAAVGRY
jgi:hypothetical protein